VRGTYVFDADTTGTPYALIAGRAAAVSADLNGPRIASTRVGREGGGITTNDTHCPFTGSFGDVRP
jgi:hypothetical protein